ASVSYSSSVANDIAFKKPFKVDATVGPAGGDIVVLTTFQPKYSARHRVSRIARVRPEGFTMTLEKPIPREITPFLEQSGDPAPFSDYSNKQASIFYMAIRSTGGKAYEWLDPDGVTPERVTLRAPTERNFFYAALVIDLDYRWRRVDMVDLTKFQSPKIFAEVQSRNDGTPLVVRHKLAKDGLYARLQNIEKCGWIPEHKSEKVGILVHEGVDETGAPIMFQKKVRDLVKHIYVAKGERVMRDIVTDLDLDMTDNVTAAIR
ncbi:unnamed protein product, partial [Amoebophrya sp. A25]